MSSTWMVTGGAGYIGNHVVAELVAEGYGVVVVDDLSTGVREAVAADIPLIQADVQDAAAMHRAITEHGVTGVVHLAARKAPGESVERPLHYYRSNVAGMIALLEAATGAGIQQFVLSSSCSVYGTPPAELVDERHPPDPSSPYGETKLICEWLLRDLAEIAALRFVSLRYFNVAGTGPGRMGDRSTSNLIPLAFQAVVAGQPPVVFGNDYPTRDGTCIRDYIHVADLARAHVAAVTYLDSGGASETFNIGRGEGFTVLEVLDTIARVTGTTARRTFLGRRLGDPARIVADPSRAKVELDWEAALGLDDMVASAWHGSGLERTPK